MIDRQPLRRMFLSAFKSEGVDYRGGGCRVVHSDLTWSISLGVDGPGARAPYRLFLGAWLPHLSDHAPESAEDCPLLLPIAYAGRRRGNASTPLMPDAVFPEWPGSEDDRAGAISRCVADVVRYARQVDSLDELRARYAGGEYDGAFIYVKLRRLLETAS